jgi:hypothetical protein
MCAVEQRDACVESHARESVLGGREERFEAPEVEDHLRLQEGCPSGDLAPQEPQLPVDVLGEWIDDRPDRQRLRGAPCRRARNELRGGHVGHMFDARHRIALHAEDRLSAERRRAHDLGLQGKPVAIAAGNVDDCPHALLPRERYRSQRRHPRLAGVIVGQPDDVDGVGQNSDPVADARAIGLGRQRDLGGR